MEKVPNGRYLKEFREEAVKLSTRRRALGYKEKALRTVT
jgi:hypothetical protein